MNKEDKKMQEMDDDALEGVSGGYVTVGKDGKLNLWGDGQHEAQGTFDNVDDLLQQAKRLGTTTEIRTERGTPPRKRSR